MRRKRIGMSFMKMIHCADLHLDSKLLTHLNREQARERGMEIVNTFQRMVEYAVKNQVRAILIAGDLFDTKSISAVVRNAVRDAILFHPSIDFFYLKGNHDQDNFLLHLEEIPSNLKLFDSYWKTYYYGNIAISGVETTKENQISLAGQLNLAQDQVNIVMLHGQESEYGAREDEQSISLRLLRQKGIDYLALGHIHSYRKERLDERGIYCYSGCLEGRGFDECGEKGFVLLDIEEDTGEITSTFIPFAKRQLHTIEVLVDCCTTSSEIARCIDAELNVRQIQGKDLVKIILAGKVDVECEKNMQYLEQRYREYYYVVKLEDHTTIAIDYNEFVWDESLKGEYVRMLQGTDLPEEDKAEIIRCGILALVGEEFVS